MAVWADYTGRTLAAAAPIRHGARIFSVPGIMTGDKFTHLPNAPELQGDFLNNFGFCPERSNGSATNCR